MCRRCWKSPRSSENFIKVFLATGERTYPGGQANFQQAICPFLANVGRQCHSCPYIFGWVRGWLALQPVNACGRTMPSLDLLTRASIAHYHHIGASVVKPPSQRLQTGVIACTLGYFSPAFYLITIRERWQVFDVRGWEILKSLGLWNRFGNQWNLWSHMISSCEIISKVTLESFAVNEVKEIVKLFLDSWLLVYIIMFLLCSIS